ncbi:DEAD/DEAH box helicase [Serratia nematodiphila]|uniref:DEAD/DEAH box helicase n=1 Tax=Serratia nematodiphila TaxID=458197 RepID=UPI0020C8F9D7|nr:DEAD/DEAH box helicase [Serratia nematodiphila]UTN99992.1 DEAD/DEAH box helicase [Serratia nematodiphila]
MLSIQEIINDEDPSKSIGQILDDLHSKGPVDNKLIEKLTYYKEFHAREFARHEENIISTLGLFYKNKSPSNLYSFILGTIGNQYKKQYGEFLTPVQASIRDAVEEKQFISISAPTSAGKSFSIKEYINKQDGDAVIIVPSRALIAEYVENLKGYFENDKSVMISTFVDYVYTNRDLRRVFVLTPERTKDLTLFSERLNVNLFFFDEAQVSEEQERGVVFDATVRRIQKLFPTAKLIFAHPFVDNPEAQFQKHNIDTPEKYSRSYAHNTVGKIFIYAHKNGNDYYFSPYMNKGHLLKKAAPFSGSFEQFAFSGNKSVLIYVSKASVYDGRFIKKFKKHIAKFEKIADREALEIINSVGDILGANNQDHRSVLVELLSIGVVIHHGSVPLEVRYLVEKFIKVGFARICFATSTLSQGINMPFDIVWLANMKMYGESEQKRCLAFKNLIGRSGRLSKNKEFDYGYVYTHNAELLSRRIKTPFKLEERSVLENPVDSGNDNHELIKSIADGTFNEDINLPESKIKRLQNDNIYKSIVFILDAVFNEGFGSKLIGSENREVRDKVKSCFLTLYEASLGRELYEGEKNVFKSAIDIVFLVMAGRSFKEIVGIRYSYISDRDGNNNGVSRFSQPANKLPESNLTRSYSLFHSVSSRDVSYDTVVFDTYDYLDTVISFSLSDVFVGAFKLYLKDTDDQRAAVFIDFLRYGTINNTHIMLMRYGIQPEDVPLVAPYLKFISEERIEIDPLLEFSDNELWKKISWYLP